MRKNDSGSRFFNSFRSSSVSADRSRRAFSSSHGRYEFNGTRAPKHPRSAIERYTVLTIFCPDTYTRHVLPAEWIASWGNITGGSNSLNAGAVAVRCYAIVKLNGATSTSAYDICGTTSCQVYNPTLTSALTDSAVNFTANW